MRNRRPARLGCSPHPRGVVARKLAWQQQSFVGCQCKDPSRLARDRAASKSKQQPWSGCGICIGLCSKLPTNSAPRPARNSTTEAPDCSPAPAAARRWAAPAERARCTRAAADPGVRTARCCPQRGVAFHQIGAARPPLPVGAALRRWRGGSSRPAGSGKPRWETIIHERGRYHVCACHLCCRPAARMASPGNAVQPYQLILGQRERCTGEVLAQVCNR